MKNLIIILFLFLFVSLSSDNYDLDQLIELTLNNNPGIQAMQYRIQAFQEKETLAVELMDPMLALEYSNVPLDDLQLDNHAMSGLQFKLQQTFPFPGKNNLRRKIAELGTGTSSFQLEEMRDMLRFRVIKAYYSLSKIRELKEISLSQISSLQDLVNSLKFKYENGKIKQHDYLRMDLLSKKLEDDLFDFDQLEKELEAVLRSTADLDDTAEIITIEPVMTFLPTETFSELYEIALKNRPELIRLKNEIAQKKLEVELAKRLKFPDITIWTGYRYRQDINGMPGEDLVSLGFSIPLNFDLSNNLKAKSNFSKHQLNKAVMDLTDKELALKTDLKTALARWERLEQKISYYAKTMMPEAESLFEVVLKSYETAGSDLSAVYQAQVQLIDFQRTYINSKFERSILKARIEMIIGY